MILKIRHKGLRKFWANGQTNGIDDRWSGKLVRILNALELAKKPSDLNFPGFKLHALKGALDGYHSVTVSGNYRVIFRFENAHVTDVDLIDYH